MAVFPPPPPYQRVRKPALSAVPAGFAETVPAVEPVVCREIGRRAEVLRERQRRRVPHHAVEVHRERAVVRKRLQRIAHFQRAAGRAADDQRLCDPFAERARECINVLGERTRRRHIGRDRSGRVVRRASQSRAFKPGRNRLERRDQQSSSIVAYNHLILRSYYANAGLRPDVFSCVSPQSPVVAWHMISPPFCLEAQLTFIRRGSQRPEEAFIRSWENS